MTTLTQKRSQKIPLLLLGLATLTSSGCQSIRPYSTQEECQGELETSCYLAADLERKWSGVEDLKWVWYPYPRAGANLVQTPTPSGGDPESQVPNQSLARKVVSELSKAIHVLRGGFGSSASHFGGGFS